MKTLKQQSGFTIVEMLVAMALVSMFLVVLTDIFTSTLSLQTEDEAAAAVSQDGRYLMQRLSYDVARASAITTPNALGGSGSTLALTIGGVTHTYSLNAGNLQLVNNLDTNALNSSGTSISAFSVQRLGSSGQPDAARVTFTVTSKKTPQAGPASQTFTITAGRR